MFFFLFRMVRRSLQGVLTRLPSRYKTALAFRPSSTSFVLLFFLYIRIGNEGKRKICPLSISSTLSHPKKWSESGWDISISCFDLYSFILFAINYVICFYYTLILISFDFIDKELGLEHLNFRKGSWWYLVS